MICPGDNRVIRPSEFPNSARSGLIVEMSITLQEIKPFRDHQWKCPRCDCIHVNVAADGDWVEW
jgi:hypothetical protein